MKMRDLKVGEAVRHDGAVWIVRARHEQLRGNLRV